MDKNDNNNYNNNNSQQVNNRGLASLRMNGSVAAWINAASIAVAVFFGAIALFGGIALFTRGSWKFDMPGLTALFSETYGASTVMMTAAIAVLAGVVGMITLRKITDINAMKKAWLLVAKIFIGVTILYALEMITIMIYALMGLGEKSGVDQGDLWLSAFLPVVIKGLVAAALAVIGKLISDGKTEVLRVMSFVGIGIAAVGLVLVFISTLVNFYAKGSSSSRGSDSSYNIDWSDLFDY